MLPPSGATCQPTHSTNTSYAPCSHQLPLVAQQRQRRVQPPRARPRRTSSFFNKQPARHGLPAAALRPMGFVCGSHTLQCPSGQASRRSCAARAHVPAVAPGRLPVRGGACSEDTPARAQAALLSMDRRRWHPQRLRHTCTVDIRTDAKQAPARPAACRPAGRLRGLAGRRAPSCPPFPGSRSAPLPLCLRMFGLTFMPCRQACR